MNPGLTVDPVAVATVGACLVAIIGGFAAWLRWARPVWRNIRRFFRRLDETLNGRPAEIDAYGRQVAPAVPPLAEQMVGVQQKLDLLAESDGRWNAIDRRVASLEAWRNDVEHLHSLERVAGHVAQAAVVDAIDKAQERADRNRAVDEPPDDT